MPSSGGLTVYCPQCEVTRAVAHYLLEVCEHAVMREGHAN